MRKPIRHVAEDGTVTFRVRYKIKEDGKWAEKTTTFRGPEKEAAKAADAFAGMIAAVGPIEALQWQRRNDEGDPDEITTPTLDDWSETYIDSRTGITDGTRHGYRRTYALSYKPHIGTKPLHQITRADIAAALNTLGSTGGRKGTGYSDKTIANAHLLLASMFKEAVAEGLISKSPCARIRLPRATSHRSAEMILMSQADFHNLLTAIPEHYRPLVMTLFGTGMRWGEAEALEVRDVDVKAKTIRINKAAKWDTSKAQRVVGPPKTPTSDRTIYIDDFVTAALLPLTLDRPRNARLFTAPRGGALRHKSFWEEAWVPACKTAEMTDPRPRIHDARHTHASWLLAKNVQILTVSRRLGHHSVKMTGDLYGHLSPESQREAADAAGAVFNELFVMPAENAPAAIESSAAAS
jgi:integrase